MMTRGSPILGNVPWGNWVGSMILWIAILTVDMDGNILQTLNSDELHMVKLILDQNSSNWRHVNGTGRF